MRIRCLLSTLSLLLVAACSSADAGELIGTWDYPLDETQAQLVVDNFAGLVDAADTVVIRLGFDGTEYWQGFMFDGDLVLVDGVPEGDGGRYVIESDQIVMTGAHGAIRTTLTWSVEGDRLALGWVEQCFLSPQGDDCTDDRSRIEAEDPFTFIVWEHAFTRSGDDPGY